MKIKKIWELEQQTIKSVTQDIKDLEAEGYKKIQGCWRCYPDYICDCPKPSKLEQLQSARYLTMTYGKK